MTEPKDPAYKFTYAAGDEYSKNYRESEASTKSEYLTYTPEPGKNKNEEGLENQYEYIANDSNNKIYIHIRDKEPVNAAGPSLKMAKWKKPWYMKRKNQIILSLCICIFVALIVLVTLAAVFLTKVEEKATTEKTFTTWTSITEAPEEVSVSPRASLTSCTFPDEPDQTSHREDRQRCIEGCTLKTYCTHFIWKKQSGGTCTYMKSTAHMSQTIQAADPGTVCGIAKINWEKERWAFGCDFVGRTFEVVTIPGEQCGDLCYENANCTHFTHSEGKCHMKSGRGRPEDAYVTDGFSSMVCGYMDRGFLL